MKLTLEKTKILRRGDSQNHFTKILKLKEVNMRKYLFIMLTLLMLCSASLFAQSRTIDQFLFTIDIIGQRNEVIATYTQGPDFDVTGVGNLEVEMYDGSGPIAVNSVADMVPIFTGYTINIKLVDTTALLRWKHVELNWSEFGGPASVMAVEVDALGAPASDTGIWTGSYTVEKGNIEEGQASILIYTALILGSSMGSWGYVPFEGPIRDWCMFPVNNYLGLAESVVLTQNTYAMGWANGDAAANTWGSFTSWGSDAWERTAYLKTSEIMDTVTWHQFRVAAAVNHEPMVDPADPLLTVSRSIQYRAYFRDFAMWGANDYVNMGGVAAENTVNAYQRRMTGVVDPATGTWSGDKGWIQIVALDYRDGTIIPGLEFPLGWLEVTIDNSFPIIDGKTPLPTTGALEDPFVRNYTTVVNLQHPDYYDKTTPGYLTSPAALSALFGQFPFTITLKDLGVGMIHNQYTNTANGLFLLNPVIPSNPFLTIDWTAPAGLMIPASVELWGDDFNALDPYGLAGDNLGGTALTESTLLSEFLLTGNRMRPPALTSNPASPLNIPSGAMGEMVLSIWDGTTSATMFDDFENIITNGQDENVVLVVYTDDIFGNKVEHRIFLTLALDTEYITPVVLFDAEIEALGDATTYEEFEYTIWNPYNAAGTVESFTTFVFDINGTWPTVVPVNHTNMPDMEFVMYYGWTADPNDPAAPKTDMIELRESIAAVAASGFVFDKNDMWENSGGIPGNIGDRYQNTALGASESRFLTSINSQWLFDNVLADSIIVEYFRAGLWQEDGWEYTDFTDEYDFLLTSGFDYRTQIWVLDGGHIMITAVPKIDAWAGTPLGLPPFTNIEVATAPAPIDTTAIATIDLITAGPEILAYVPINLEENPPASDEYPVTYILRHRHATLLGPIMGGVVDESMVAAYLTAGWDQTAYDYSILEYDRTPGDESIFFELDMPAGSFGIDITPHNDGATYATSAMTIYDWSSDTEPHYFSLTFYINEVNPGDWDKVHHFGLDIDLVDKWGHPAIYRKIELDASGDFYVYGDMVQGETYYSYHNVGDPELPNPLVLMGTLNLDGTYNPVDPAGSSLFADSDLGPDYQKYWELQYTAVQFTHGVDQLIYWMPQIHALVPSIDYPSWDELNDPFWWENLLVEVENNISLISPITWAEFEVMYGFTVPVLPPVPTDTEIADYLAEFWQVNHVSYTWNEEVFNTTNPVMLERMADYFASTRAGSTFFTWHGATPSDTRDNIESILLANGCYDDFFLPILPFNNSYPIWTNIFNSPRLDDINGKVMMVFEAAAILVHEEYDIGLIGLLPTDPEPSGMADEPVGVKYVYNQIGSRLVIDRIPYLTSVDIFEKDEVSLRLALLEGLEDFDMRLKIWVGNFDIFAPADQVRQIQFNTLYDTYTLTPADIMNHGVMSPTTHYNTGPAYPGGFLMSVQHIANFMRDFPERVVEATFDNNWTWEFVIPIKNFTGHYDWEHWSVDYINFYPDFKIRNWNGNLSPSITFDVLDFRNPWRTATHTTDIELDGSPTLVTPPGWFIPEQAAYVEYNYFTVDVAYNDPYTVPPVYIAPGMNPWNALWGHFDNFLDILSEPWFNESDYADVQRGLGLQDEGIFLREFNPLYPFDRDEDTVTFDPGVYRHIVEWLITQKPVTTPAPYPQSVDSNGAIHGPNGVLVNAWADGSDIEYSLLYDAYKQLWEPWMYTHSILVDKDFPIYDKVRMTVIENTGVLTFADIQTALALPTTKQGNANTVFNFMPPSYSFSTGEFYIGDNHSVYIRMDASDAPGVGVTEAQFIEFDHADWTLEVYEDATGIWIDLSAPFAGITLPHMTAIADTDGYFYLKLTPNALQYPVTGELLEIPLGWLEDVFERRNYNGVNTEVSGTRYLPEYSLWIQFAGTLDMGNMEGLIAWEDFRGTGYFEGTPVELRKVFSAPYVRENSHFWISLNDQFVLPPAVTRSGSPDWDDEIFEVYLWGINSWGTPLVEPNPVDPDDYGSMAGTFHPWWPLVPYIDPSTGMAVPGVYNTSDFDPGIPMSGPIPLDYWGYTPVDGDILGVYVAVWVTRTYKGALLGLPPDRILVSNQWTYHNQIGQDLMVVDLTIPDFTDTDVNVYNDYDATGGNYVIPGQGVIFEIFFEDETGYTSVGSVPSMFLSHLDLFLTDEALEEFFGASALPAAMMPSALPGGYGADVPVWQVPSDWFSIMDNTHPLFDPLSRGQWIVKVPDSVYLQAKSDAEIALLGTHLVNMRVFVYDAVGNFREGGRTVVLATDGPPVPLIVDARYEIQLHEGSAVDFIHHYLVDSDGRADTIQPHADQVFATYIYTNHIANISVLHPPVGATVTFGPMNPPHLLTTAELIKNGFPYAGNLYRLTYPIVDPTTFDGTGIIEQIVEAFVIPPPAAPVYTQMFSYDESIVTKAPTVVFDHLAEPVALGLGGAGKDVPVPGWHPDYPMQVSFEINLPTESMINGTLANKIIQELNTDNFDFTSWFRLDSTILAFAAGTPEYDTWVVPTWEVRYYRAGGYLVDAADLLPTTNLVRIVLDVKIRVDELIYDPAYPITDDVIYALTYDNIFKMERGGPTLITAALPAATANPKVSSISLLEALNTPEVDTMEEIGAGDWLRSISAQMTGIERTDWSIIRMYYEDAIVGLDPDASTFMFGPAPDVFAYYDNAFAMQELIDNLTSLNYVGEVGFDDPATWLNPYIQFDLGKIYSVFDATNNRDLFMTAWDLWIGPYFIEIFVESMFAVPADEYPYERFYNHTPVPAGIVLNTPVPNDTHGQMALYTADEEFVWELSVGQVGGMLNEVTFGFYMPNYAMLEADEPDPSLWLGMLYNPLSVLIPGAASTLYDMTYWVLGDAMPSFIVDRSAPYEFKFNISDLFWTPEGYYAAGPGWNTWLDTFLADDAFMPHLIRVTAISETRSITERDFRINVYDNTLPIQADVIGAHVGAMIPADTGKSIIVDYNYFNAPGNIIDLWVGSYWPGDADAIPPVLPGNPNTIGNPVIDDIWNPRNNLRYIELYINDDLAGGMYDGLTPVATTYPSTLVQREDLDMQFAFDFNYISAFDNTADFLDVAVWAVVYGFKSDQVYTTQQYTVRVRFTPIAVNNLITLFKTAPGLGIADEELFDTGLGINNVFGYHTDGLDMPPYAADDVHIIGYGQAPIENSLRENLIRIEADFSGVGGMIFGFTEAIERFRFVYRAYNWVTETFEAPAVASHDITGHNMDVQVGVDGWIDSDEWWHFSNLNIRLPLVLSPADFNLPHMEMRTYFYFVEMEARPAYESRVEILDIAGLVWEDVVDLVLHPDLDPALLQYIAIPKPEFANSSIVVDHRPPALSSFSPVDMVINWKNYQEFSGEPVVGVDLIDFLRMTDGNGRQYIVAEWSIDGIEWHEDDDFEQYYYPATNTFVAYGLNLNGASEHSFLGEWFEGPIQVKVSVMDDPGNAVIYLFTDVMVDNNPPSTRSEDVAHYYIIDNSGVSVSIDFTQVYDISVQSELKMYLDADPDLAAVRLYTRNELTYPDWTYLWADVYPTYGPNADQYEFWLTREGRLPEGKNEFVVIGMDGLSNIEAVRAGFRTYMATLFVGDTDMQDYIDAWFVDPADPALAAYVYHAAMAPALAAIPKFMSLTGSDTRDLTLNLVDANWFAAGGWVDQVIDGVRYYTQGFNIATGVADITFPFDYSWVDAKERIDFTIDIYNAGGRFAEIQFPAADNFVRSTTILSASVFGPMADEVTEVEFWGENGWIGTATRDADVTVQIRIDYARIAQLYGSRAYEHGMFVLDAAGVNVLGMMVRDDVNEYYYYDAVLTANDMHTFNFAFDFMNDGVFNPGLHPWQDNVAGILQRIFVTSEFSIPFDTHDFDLGIHQFWAVALHPDYSFDSPRVEYFVDNVAPVITQFSATTPPLTHFLDGVLHARANQEVHFEATVDHNQILVPLDDFINGRIVYQFSPDAPATELGSPYIYRRWFNVDPADVLSNMWLTLDPLTDGYDNDGDGVLDNPEEANSKYYIRAIVRDRAGNFAVHTADDYYILVDNSIPVVMLISANGDLLTDTHNIISIPEDNDGVITLVGEWDGQFDSPLTTDVYVRTTIDPFGAQNWLAWERIATDVEVINGLATVDWVGPFIEGYYQISFDAVDLVGNRSNHDYFVTVVLNDVHGRVVSEILSVNGFPVIANEALIIVDNLFSLDGDFVVNAFGGAMPYDLVVQWAYEADAPDLEWTDAPDPANLIQGLVNNNINLDLPWTLANPVRVIRDYYVRIKATTAMNPSYSEPVRLIHTVAPYDFAPVSITNHVVYTDPVTGLDQDILRFNEAPGTTGYYNNTFTLDITDPNSHVAPWEILENNRINEMYLRFQDVNSGDWFYFILQDPETYQFRNPIGPEYTLGQIYEGLPAVLPRVEAQLPLEEYYDLFVQAFAIDGHVYWIPWLENVHYVPTYDIRILSLTAGVYVEPLLLGTDVFTGRYNNLISILLDNDGYVDGHDLFLEGVNGNTYPRTLLEAPYRLADAGNSVRFILHGHPLDDFDFDSGDYRITFIGKYEIEYCSAIFTFDLVAPVINITYAPAILDNVEYKIMFSVEEVDNYIDEIDVNSLELWIAEYPGFAYVPAPKGLDYEVVVTRQGISNYTAIFYDTDIAFGRYRMQLYLTDNAQSIGNLAITDFPGQYYILDEDDPTVDITGFMVNGGANLILDAVRIVRLGEEYTVSASGFDYDLAAIFPSEGSGIREFIYRVWSNDGVPQLKDTFVVPYTDPSPFPAPYQSEYTFTTMGRNTGDYFVTVQTVDYAENTSPLARVDFTMINGTDQDPYAIITGFYFSNVANQSRIYTQIVDWNASVINELIIDQFDGVSWTNLTTIPNPGLTAEVTFNPISMASVEQLRTTVVYGGGIISTLQPILEVEYNTLTDELEPINQDIEIALWWENVTHVYNALTFPIINRISAPPAPNRAAYTTSFNNFTGIYEGTITPAIAAAGTYYFWAADIDIDNMMMMLSKTELIVGAPTITTTDLQVTNVNGGFVYLQNLLINAELDELYEELVDQVGIWTAAAGNQVSFTAEINPLVDDMVGAVYADGAWTYYPVTVSGNLVTFVGTGRGIYTILTAPALMLEFVSFIPQYIDADGEYWTRDETTIRFKAYMIDSNPNAPVYVPQVAVPTIWINGQLMPGAVYQQGWITWVGNVPEAGLNSVRVRLVRNAVEVEQTIYFNVDITFPVINALSGTLPEDRTIRATIVDPETDIDQVFVIFGGDGRRLRVTERDGDEFIYTLLLADLADVGNQFTVIWEAINNLGMDIQTNYDVTYSVNVEVPMVSFISPNQSYIARGMDVEFQVLAPQGVQLAANGVNMVVEEWCWVMFPGEDNYHQTWEVIQTLTFNGQPDANNLYEFSYTYNTPQQAQSTLVRFTVTAADNYGNTGFNQIAYGIYDLTTPPAINISTLLDEMEILIGDQPTAVANLFASNGIASVQTILHGPARVELYNDTEIIDGAPTYLSYVAPLPVLEAAGNYTLIMIVTDAAMNSANTSVTFVIVADTEAPVVTIHTPVEGQEFFIGNAPVVNATMTDNFGIVLAMLQVSAPDGDIVYDELFDYGDSIANRVLIETLPVLEMTGNYTISVVAIDAAGNQGAAGVTIFVAEDTEAPIVTIYAPTEGQVFDEEHIVGVLAIITDNDAVASWTLQLTGPNGIMERTGTSEEVAEEFIGLEAGEYTILLTAVDPTGNRDSDTVSFVVRGISQEPIIDIYSDNDFWLAATTNNVLTFTVTGVASNMIESVIGNIYANGLGGVGELIQTQQAVLNDGVYNINMHGAALPQTLLGVLFEVEVTHNYGLTAISTQLYTIDHLQPVITLLTPEDGAVLVGPGANVYITANIIDPQTLGSRSAASGLARTSLTIFTPTAQQMDYEYTTDLQVLAQMVSLPEFGNYIASIRAWDAAGNTSIHTFGFLVRTSTDDAPTIVFNELANGNWIDLKNNNEITFTVNAITALRTVEATVYAMPGEVELPSANPVFVNNRYLVNLQGNQIPADATSIKVVAVATDITGNPGTGTHVYDIYRVDPSILTFHPADGVEFIYVEDLVINVDATYTTELGANFIANAKLVMIDPTFRTTTPVTTGAGITELAYVIDPPLEGDYVLTLTVNDKLGNTVTKTHRFTVIVPIILPPDDLLSFDKDNPAIVYPNPGNTDDGVDFDLKIIGGKATDTINIRIYDFAGRLVRELETGSLYWDGRSDKGHRVARGTYFARATVRNNTKIVESVVKVAIIK